MLTKLNPFIRLATRQWFHNRAPYERRAVDYHLFYGLDGNLRMTVEEEEYLLCEGNVLILPPHTKYNLISASDGQTHFGVIDFELTPKNAHLCTAITPYAADDEATVMLDVDVFAPFDAPLFITEAKFMQKDITTIINNFLLREELYREFSSALLKRALLGCVRAVNREKRTYSPLVSKVLYYITSNYFLPITNASLGEMFGYAPGYINARFKKEVGMTLHEYVIWARLKRSRFFLKSEDVSIAEISNRCGFSSPAHYTAMFRRTYGKTPREFRESEESY